MSDNFANTYIWLIKNVYARVCEQIPAIVYFEKQIPNIYDGDLMAEEQILHWLVGQLEHDEIEDVTDEMLDKMVKEGRVMAVLFCNYTNQLTTLPLLLLIVLC